MIEIKSNGDSKRKKSKSSSQHVEEKRMRSALSFRQEYSIYDSQQYNEDSN